MVALRGPGVRHSDGYIELRDRAKDIVISSGENISTIEIEHAIESHLAVLELQTHIARFKPPGNFELVDHLPRTSTSKLQKFELREKDWAGRTSRTQG